MRASDREENCDPARGREPMISVSMVPPWLVMGIAGTASHLLPEQGLSENTGHQIVKK